MRILTTDFVTNVDLTVHNTLRSQLFQLAPAVQFLGEEAGGRVTPPRRAPLPSGGQRRAGLQRTAPPRPHGRTE